MRTGAIILRSWLVLAEGMLHLSWITLLVMLLKIQLSDAASIGFFGRYYWTVQDYGLGVSGLALACLAGAVAVRNRFWTSRRALAGVIGKVLLMGMSLGTCLVAAEFLIRAVLKETRGFSTISDLEKFEEGQQGLVGEHALSVITRISSNPKIIYELKPNQDRTFGRQLLKTNSLGMRDREYSPAKPPGTLRIVGIGDSGMFGWEVNEPECFLSVLEANLNRKEIGRKVEVLNFGIPGYNTRQEVSMLEHHGLQFDPDIVVVHWCVNDYFLPFFLFKEPDLDRRDVSFLFLRLFDPDRYHQLVRPVPVMFTDIDEKIVDPSLLSSSGPEGVKAAMLDLMKLSREHDFHVLVFGPMSEKTEALFGEVGVRYCNTYRRIPPGKYPSDYGVFLDHPSAEGHRALADHLEAWLREAGFLQ